MICGYVYADGQHCKAHAKRDHEYCQSHLDFQPGPAREEPAVGRDAARAKPRPPAPTVDPQLVAGAMQQMLLNQEVEERLRHTRERQKLRDRDGYELPEAGPGHAPPPVRVIPRRRAGDATVPVGCDGKPLRDLRVDFVQRYVRERDHLDRPTQARVGEFDEYGFVAVKDNDGTDFRNRFGLLMQGPPEQAALRSADNTPRGASMRDEALWTAQQMADAANQAAGDDVTRVVVSDEHRSVRTLEGSGVELLTE